MCAKSGEQDLKEILTRKHNGYLTILKTEFLKKTKKVKLPKPAPTTLLHWWTDHYRWPYPTSILTAHSGTHVEQSGMDECDWSVYTTFLIIISTPFDIRHDTIDQHSISHNLKALHEEEKMKLSEETGVDQKQINNWFVNQRKRQWKPSPDIQFALLHGGN
ncbi:Octamer-binding transcription factor [Parasponia andersonii]|uniref:Octamer-binding transcription factor n=1 Tax=Parasponia andersonii TaxID=3476 RepID=A0A2P5BHG6_PARAD|nr:Octamer-binding transcription factor [Parasponia andersonii]